MKHDKTNLVNTWQRAYTTIYKRKSQVKARLTELQTWDKPRAGNELEHSAKIQALENLLK